MDDQITPPRAERRAHAPSEGSRALANFAVALQALASNCAEHARNLDGIAGPERKARLYELSNRLGEIGDLSHEARRTLTALAGELEDEPP